MCRHLVWLGEPVTPASLVLDPPHGLLRQAYAPRHQTHGAVNADGFGAGWYADVRPEPVRYRRAQPVWSDASFASLAPTVASHSVLAAVRDATPGFAASDESCTAPFQQGRWLFSHGGALADWTRARKGLLHRTLETPEASAPVDSALLFGVAVAAWSAGASLGDGLAATVQAGNEVGGGRMSFVATDGETIAATAYGDPLFCLERADGVLLASEPYDDDRAWRRLPERCLATADRSGVTVLPLDD